MPRAVVIILLAAALGMITVFADLPLPRDNASHEPLVHARGIGALMPGAAYAEALALTRQSVSGPVLDGPGCDGRDQISYQTTFADMPASVMAMADRGYLDEVEIWLSTPRWADDEAACLSLRDRFGQPFLERSAMSRERSLVRPVSREHRVEIGPVVLYAQWFPSDRTCYVGVRFE